MTAAFVVTSAEAEGDVEDIARYIAADSIWSAQRFGDEFSEALDGIRAFPESNRGITGKPDLRVTRVSARFWRYLIVYRLANSGVEILRVLHGAMDINAQLAKSERD